MPDLSARRRSAESHGMGDDEKAPEKPVRDTRGPGAASGAPGVAWWPASRLLLDMIKQG